MHLRKHFLFIPHHLEGMEHLVLNPILHIVELMNLLLV